MAAVKYTDAQVNAMVDDARRGNQVEMMQSRFLLRMGVMYGKGDNERARTVTEVCILLMFSRLEALTAGKPLHAGVHYLVDQAPKAAPKDMGALRQHAGDTFEQVGITNQHSPSSAACYTIYLLAGAYNDINERSRVYAIADAFAWVEKAGENMEGLWAQINLLLD